MSEEVCKYGTSLGADLWRPHWDYCGGCGRDLLKRLEEYRMSLSCTRCHLPVTTTINGLCQPCYDVNSGEMNRNEEYALKQEAQAVKTAKPQITLIPPTAILQEARAMENGLKYGRNSWHEKDRVGAYEMADAMMRHILDWLNGEENAPDSGVHHLAHVRAGAGILLDALEKGVLNDDRVDGVGPRVSRDVPDRQ